MNFSRFRLYSLFLLAVLVAAPTGLHAQIGIYAAGTGASLRNAGTDWGYGGLVGVYKQSGYAASIINIGGDLRGSFVSRNGFHYYTGAVGPRIAFKPHVIPLDPYIEGLVGVASYNTGSGTSTSTHFNYQVVGGLDATIFPHLDWRVIDVAYSGVSGQDIKATTFSTGLVFRLW
jgi:hypothetical protein